MSIITDEDAGRLAKKLLERMTDKERNEYLHDLLQCEDRKAIFKKRRTLDVADSVTNLLNLSKDDQKDVLTRFCTEAGPEALTHALSMNGFQLR